MGLHVTGRWLEESWPRPQQGACGASQFEPLQSARFAGSTSLKWGWMTVPFRICSIIFLVLLVPVDRLLFCSKRKLLGESRHKRHIAGSSYYHQLALFWWAWVPDLVCCRMLGRQGLTLRRHVSMMATHTAPAEPLLVVLGSTGTGKSEVGVSGLITTCIGSIL